MYIVTGVFAAIIGLALFWKFFSRDPYRETPHGQEIISPADGKIGSIFKVKGEDVDSLRIKKGVVGKIVTSASEIAKECVIITIVMRMRDVHVQRSPIPGEVVSIKHTKGKFVNAILKPSKMTAFNNEKNEIIIKNDKLTLKVIQIAGMVARRIECFIKKGDSLEKGQKIGRINLGSQVVLMLPDKVDIFVKPKQKVYAGTSIIAELK